MSDYSIEIAAERILDARTKRYFAEVLKSYYSGCFRSAVVMLWSVAICDLLFKLAELSDHYGDPTAKKILTEIEAIRVENPNSPEWEWKLVGLIRDRTHLLEAGDYIALESLQKHRHLSAHPVLSAAEVLFEPNKEAVRAHIRNTLDSVLIKPAMMSKKIFDAFVEDLETSAPIIPDDRELEKYLTAKYFLRLTPAVEQGIFRSLWRLVFRTEDARCEANRTVNLRALSIIYGRSKDNAIASVAAERDYFSDVGMQGTRFDLFLRYIGAHPELFSILTDAAKTPLQAAATGSLSNFARAWFLSATPQDHIREIDRRIRLNQYLSGEAFEDFLEAATEMGLRNEALDIAILQFGWSASFDMADGYFVSLIKPYLSQFSKNQLLNLVKDIESNGQIYGRGRAASHHRLIKTVLDGAFGGAFEYACYPKFAESIGIELKSLPEPEVDKPF